MRVVTNVGRDAMDAMALLTRSAKADGEAVWSWHPKAGAKLVDEVTSDGGNKVWLTGESTE